MVQAFIADSRLYVRDNAGGVREIKSPFATRRLEDAERRGERRAWLSGSGDQADPYQAMLWGRRGVPGQVSPHRFTDIIPVDDHTLFYVLSDLDVTGLFKYDLGRDEELRLFHTNHFMAHGMDYSAERGHFVAAVQGSDGRVSLEILDGDGKVTETLTEGDACDTMPAFSAAHAHQILFQSAGIARGEDGFPVAFGPSSVNRLDLDRGELTELLSDEGFDYLLPREDTAGRLYCIRRPYLARSRRSHLAALKEAALFPLRVVSAIFGFIMAFVQLFDRGSMKPAGPEVQRPPENKYVQVLGQTIDLAKVGGGGGSADGPSLVPKSWELIRRDPDGSIHVVDRNVSSYDLDRNGHVICTNGYRVREVCDDRAKTTFHHKVIQILRSV